MSQRDSRIGAFHKLRIDDGSPRGAMLASFYGPSVRHGRWSDTEVTELGEQLDRFDHVLFLVQPGSRACFGSASSVTLAHRHGACWRISGSTAGPPRAAAGGAGLRRAIGLSAPHSAGRDCRWESCIFGQRLDRCRELLLDSRHRHRGIRRTGVPGRLHPPVAFQPACSRTASA